MSQFGRLAANLIVGGLVLGCSVGPSGSSVGPTIEVSATPSSATSTVPRSGDPPSLVGLQIDARRVIAAARLQCTGGPLGGEASDTMSYDVWTLHCPAESGTENGPAKLVDALKAEVALSGATIEDEGEILSYNAGNEGDAQVTLHGRFEDVEIWIRVTSLKGGDGWSMVVTIDQRSL